MEKVLVTGGMGFIGSHLVTKLLEDHIVFVVDDFSNSIIEPLETFGVTQRNIIAPMLPYYKLDEDPKDPLLIVVEADFTHASIIKLVESGDFDCVFHLAAQPRVEWSVENPLQATDENFTKTLELAKACAEGNTKFVFSSTAAVYGNPNPLEMPTQENGSKNPTNPYGLGKLCAEQYLSLFEDLYDLNWVALRYFNVYGPGQPGDSPYSTAVSAWCHKALEGESLRSDGDGEQTRDMIYVSDVISANIHAANLDLSRNYRIFNVGTGVAVSNNYILSKFAQKGYADVDDAPERTGDVRDTLADIGRLEETGWTAEIDFDDGLSSVLDYWNL